MISLASPSIHPALRALAGSGGFAWWYVDLVDEAGNGLVLIWSFGLPFLPGIRATPGPPRARPALVLSIYEAHREAFYLFREFPPEEVSWDPATGAGRFGDTHILLDQTDGGVALDVVFQLDVPGSSRPLLGDLSLRGPRRRGGAWGEEPRHQWMPLTAATTATASFGGAWTGRRAGRAYLDHNCGTVPMTALGIRRWSWGRLAFPDHELIWYALTPEDGGAVRSLVVRLDTDGTTRVAERRVDEVGRRWSWSAVGRPAALRFDDVDGVPVEVRVGAPVDDAPFYQRSLVTGTRAGVTAVGTSELVLPPRLDLPFFRPFVAMRVARPGPHESALLPWFSGATRTRWARLLGFDLPSLDRLTGPARPPGAPERP